MNQLTPSELEALCLFLATHQRMFAALCRDMRADPDKIARTLTQAHAEAVVKL